MQKLGGQAQQARTEYDNIPNSDTIAKAADDRAALQLELSELAATYTALGQEIERQGRELEKREQALARLIESDANEKGVREDRSRILRHAGRVRSTLTAFRRSVITRHVARIERLVFESYKQLLRKAALVSALSIDPQTYSLTLFAQDGEVLNAERLSAGERQLLALALLWGLGKASGRPLPTAIDTPLGRLDSGHRIHLVERYLPYASHQTLLLSTDEEITGEYLRRLDPWIGRMYLLRNNDATGATHIETGYLEETRGSSWQ